MRRGAKMLMIAESRGGNRGGGNRGGRSEMEMRNEMRGGMGNGMEMGYSAVQNEMEMRRRRDSRGRFRSEMEMGGMENEMEMRRGGGRGGSAGRNEMGYGEMEMRRRGSGSRSEMDGGYSEMESRGGYGRSEMESRGRYGDSEMRNGYGESEMRSEMRGYPNRPFPVYEGGGSNMNLIGFDPSREIETNYPMNATHKGGNEMEYRKSQQMGGYSSSGAAPSLNMEMAEEWTGQMKNEDGTKGPHWKFEQVKQLMSQKGIQGNPVHLWVALNMLYSDYCAVFKKYGVNSVDLYADLAMAFLKDTDAGAKDKLASYYQYVVKG